MPARRAVLVLALVALVVAALRRRRGAVHGRSVEGGILMADPGGYDRLSRLVFGSLFGPIAADVAATTPARGRVLEVGCGPGHLSVRLVRDHGLDVTGLDLDPAMIDRAVANATRAAAGEGRSPSFVVGDVASLPFDDNSFDTIVSTFSLHHWSDPGAGLAEIARVLRPGGRALVWDLNPGFRLFHRHVDDPAGHFAGSSLRLVRVDPWRWPWQVTLARRMELAPAE